jgi:uncharacterized protein YbaR (Trm112 family)
MLVCPYCGKDVYIQQRKTSFKISCYEPYYCWMCNKFLDYNEVEVKK